MRWRRTWPDMEDDWCLRDDDGHSLARIYRSLGNTHRPNGYWQFFIQCEVPGLPEHQRRGIVDTGKEAKDACELAVARLADDWVM